MTRRDRLFQPTPPAVQSRGPQRGTIREVTPDGVMFVIDSYDKGKHVFGPAPYPRYGTEPAGDHGGHPGASGNHDHAWTEPQPGQDCLVVFAGEGIEDPWVLVWWIG